MMRIMMTNSPYILHEGGRLSSEHETHKGKLRNTQKIYSENLMIDRDIDGTILKWALKL